MVNISPLTPSKPSGQAICYFLFLFLTLVCREPMSETEKLSE